MPIVTRYTTAQNIGTFNHRTNNKTVPYKYFIENPLVVIKNPKIEIEFYSKNDVLLFRIPEGIRDTILNSIEWNHDFRGCADLTVKLLTATPFPLTYGCKIRISVSGIVAIGKTIYTGYLYKPQSEFNSKKGLFEYKFFGLRKRYEKQEITLPTYSISSIGQSGSNSTFNVSSISGISIGQVIAVRRCDNDLNNDYFTITGFTGTSVTVINAVGVAQATSGGDFVVLPIEWSSANLLSEVFKSVAYLASIAFGIGYNPSKIETSSGYSTAGLVDFSEMDYDKAFESIEKMAYGFAAMGVDEYGDFFFKVIPSNVITVLNTGYEINDPGLTLNYNNLANVITGERTKGRNSTTNGFDVVTTALPLVDVNLSIAKYGVYTKRVQVPAYLSDNVIQQIVDADLQQNKEPRYSAKIDDVKFDRFYEIGDYAVCPLPDIYTDVVSECDSLTNWTDDTNITLAINTDVLVTGNGALQISAGVASIGESFYYSLTYDLFGKKSVEMWLRSNQRGDFLTMQLTDGVTTENYPIYIDTVDQYYRVIIDIDPSVLTSLTEIRFEFGASTVNGTIVYIDELSIKRLTATHVRMPFKKATYKLTPHTGGVNLEFGLESEKLSEFLQGLQTQIETNKIGARNK